MLSTVVTVLMLSVMLFVITKFIIGALRQHRHLLPSSWYRKHRTLVSLGLLLMILLTLFVQSGLADGTFRSLSRGFSAFILSHSSALDIQAIAHSLHVNTSQ